MIATRNLKPLRAKAEKLPLRAPGLADYEQH
jgi:hypothetical protein